jgi:DNA uptake protein ComE-like DNA-binding protein
MFKTAHRGFALLGILIVIMLASMVAISLLFRLRAEETSAAAGEGSEQAWSAAMAGVEQALDFVLGGDPASGDWLDNPQAFKDRLVADDGAEKWYFTIYSAGENAEAVRYGLADESAKLNINDASLDMLAKLPGLKAPQAQALRDFLDADNEPQPEGAEQEYYDLLPTPYSVRNGGLDTIDEMLLVRGFTPAVLYGDDANMNCRLDPNEDDGSERFPPDNKDGALNRGLRDLTTVASYDLNVDQDGAPRTDINDPEDPLYTNGLPETVVHYINVLRQNKGTVLHPADLLAAKGKFKDDKGKEMEVESGVGKEELPAVLDLLTADIEFELPGLININTASAAVLQTIPGIDASTAEAIVSTRHGLTPDKRRSPAWIFQEDLVNADTFKNVAPYITTRAWQFSFYVVGFGLPSGRYRVLEVTIDTAADVPSVTYLRDITRLGLPFPLLQTPGDGITFREARLTTKSEQVGPAIRHLNNAVQLPRRQNNG